MRRVLYLLLPLLAVGFGAGEVSVNVENATDVYIHARVGEHWLLYIPPGGSSTSLQLPEGKVECFACSVPGTAPAKAFMLVDTLDVQGEPAQVACEYLKADQHWKVERQQGAN